MKRWLLILGVVALVVIAAVAYVRMDNGQPVEVARVTRGDIREWVEERAETRLPRTYLITMPYTERIEPITVTEGERVKAGQVLAQVVPLDMNLAVEEAQAAVERLDAAIRENDDTSVELTSLLQAKKFVESMDRTVEAAVNRVTAGYAKRKVAENRLTRAVEAAKSGAKTAEQVEEVELAVTTARVDHQQDELVRAALEAMQAATALVPTMVQQYIDRKSLARAVLEKEKAQADVKLRQILNDQQRGMLASPIDGVVLERFETNEREITAGTVLLSIGRLEDLEVEVELLSEDVVHVDVGDPVELFGPAIGQTSAHGTVSRIYPAGFTKTSSLGVEQQRVLVIVHFAESELERLRTERDLGVGYRVRVRIFTDENDDALLVPRSALFRGPRGDWQAFVVRDGTAQLQSLEVGLMNDETVEILKGVAADELVILAPETNLTANTKVSAVIP